MYLLLSHRGPIILQNEVVSNEALLERKNKWVVVNVAYIIFSEV